jgi:transcriptional regulator of acetoin/glycerol metabolism
LHDPFIAVDTATDLRSHARRLRKAWEAAMEDDPGGAGVRSVIELSWSRMAAAGLRPDALHPRRALAPDELEEVREDSLLSRCMPALRHCLGSFAYDAEHVMVVCDAAGRVLWVEGHDSVRRRAEGITFTEGMLWTEDSAGTNAIGTALAIDHPVQIFSAEHFLAEQHPWWCSAAPIHNPATGALLGIVDLSGPMRTAHPHSLALVMAAAGMAEAALAADYAQREIRPRRGRPRPAERALELRLLGTDALTATAGGQRLPLSLRQAEILAVLALYPDGLTADQLTLHLYGEEGNRISTRAAMSRLRKLLGARLAAQPYRLVGDVRADFLEIEAQLAVGHAEEALRAYGRPLLPESEAPRVVQARAELEGALRRAALAGTASQLWAWLQTETGEDDLLAMERFLRRTPAGDPGRPIVAARMQSLRQRWGMPAAR